MDIPDLSFRPGTAPPFSRQFDDSWATGQSSTLFARMRTQRRRHMDGSESRRRRSISTSKSSTAVADVRTELPPRLLVACEHFGANGGAGAHAAASVELLR